MDKFNIGIFVYCQNSKSELFSLTDQLKEAKLDGLIINATQLKLTEADLKQLKVSCAGQLKVILVNDIDLCQAHGFDGVMFTELGTNCLTLKNEYPNLILAGVANDIATAKNWEMAQADFILFESKDISQAKSHSSLLATKLKSFIPKKDVYGWNILTINTPIYSYGVTSQAALEELVETTAIQGVVLTDEFVHNPEFSEVIESLRLLYSY